MIQISGGGILICGRRQTARLGTTPVRFQLADGRLLRCNDCNGMPASFYGMFPFHIASSPTHEQIPPRPTLPRSPSVPIRNFSPVNPLETHRALLSSSNRICAPRVPRSPLTLTQFVRHATDSPLPRSHYSDCLHRRHAPRAVAERVGLARCFIYRAKRRPLLHRPLIPRCVP